jgi:hypothetical protein
MVWAVAGAPAAASASNAVKITVFMSTSGNADGTETPPRTAGAGSGYCLTPGVGSNCLVMYAPAILSHVPFGT